MGNWSEIKLVEPNPNRNAVGARITIKTGTRSQTRFVDIGGGDASGHAGFIHVGLGTAERAEIRVQWPDGEHSAALPSVRQPVRGHRPHEATGGVLVSAPLNAKIPITA